MGNSGFSVFEFHFGDSDSDGTERERRGSDRRRPTPAERRERRSNRRGGDGGGSKLKTGLTVLGALSVVGGLAGAAWYLLRGRGDGDGGPGGGPGADGRRREVTVVGGSAVRTDSGTASLVGLAFLLAVTAVVRRYVVDDSAAALAERVEDADEVTVLASDDGGE